MFIILWFYGLRPSILHRHSILFPFSERWGFSELVSCNFEVTEPTIYLQFEWISQFHPSKNHELCLIMYYQYEQVDSQKFLTGDQIILHKWIMQIKNWQYVNTILVQLVQFMGPITLLPKIQEQGSLLIIKQRILSQYSRKNQLESKMLKKMDRMHKLNFNYLHIFWYVNSKK